MFTVADVKGDFTGKRFFYDFHCSYSQLKSLEGAPKIVHGRFNCSNNYEHLTSLKYAPKIVYSDCFCHNNNLQSLEGVPEIVGENFYCHGNDLISLEGAPKSVGGNYYCDKELLEEENLYIIASALLNGRKDKKYFEEEALDTLIEYF